MQIHWWYKPENPEIMMQRKAIEENCWGIAVGFRICIRHQYVDDVFAITRNIYMVPQCSASKYGFAVGTCTLTAWWLSTTLPDTTAVGARNPLFFSRDSSIGRLTQYLSYHMINRAFCYRGTAFPGRAMRRIPAPPYHPVSQCNASGHGFPFMYFHPLIFLSNSSVWTLT